MEPLVSIVTLTYKRFDKLKSAIDSVLAQDYSNIEYIISDDGSDNFPREETKAYIDAHKNGNIRSVVIIKHEQNRGTVQNINGAYRQAKGEYLLPLSGDDEFFDSTVVSRIVKEFEARNCDVLVATRALYDRDNRFIRNIPNAREAEKIGDHIPRERQYEQYIMSQFYEAFSGSTLYVKKSFMEDRGYFDKKYVLWEDGPFFAQYLWKHHLDCAYDLVAIKYNEGGVSTTKNPIMLRDMEQYMHTDMMEHLNEQRWIVRDVVLYGIERYSAKNALDKIKIILRHMPGYLVKKSYRARKRIMESRE